MWFQAHWFLIASSSAAHFKHSFLLTDFTCASLYKSSTSPILSALFSPTETTLHTEYLWLYLRFCRLLDHSLFPLLPLPEPVTLKSDSDLALWSTFWLSLCSGPLVFGLRILSVVDVDLVHFYSVFEEDCFLAESLERLICIICWCSDSHMYVMRNAHSAC